MSNRDLPKTVVNPGAREGQAVTASYKTQLQEY